MNSDWIDQPDADDVITGWAVPLDEPPTLTQTPIPLLPRVPVDEAPESFLLRGDDGLLSSEFHPRLRRFGEGE